jgi:hypothetical protein
MLYVISFLYICERFDSLIINQRKLLSPYNEAIGESLVDL